MFLPLFPLHVWLPGNHKRFL